MHTVEVSVIGSTHAFVESESPPWHHTDSVTHDGDSVERRLSIEQHDITMQQMALYNITIAEFLGLFPSVSKFEGPA